jgi:hypothetical protein
VVIIIIIIIIGAASESRRDVSCLFVMNAYACGRGRTIFLGITPDIQGDFMEKPEFLSRASIEIQTR